MNIRMGNQEFFSDSLYNFLSRSQIQETVGRKKSPKSDNQPTPEDDRGGVGY